MKKLHTLLALCLALLSLAACSDNFNLFGSSSGNSNCGKDIKCLRIDAENAFRRGDYSESYKICDTIVQYSPTSSFGYFGMAKAGLWVHEINPLSIFSLVKLEKDECPFMGEDVRTQNNYFQAMKKVVPALSELDRRDSLTVIYEFHKRDSLSRATKGKGFDTTFIVTVTENGNSTSKSVNLSERLKNFREVFCGNSPTGACSDTTKRKESFPLSDREYKNSYFGGILLLSSFSRWFLGFFDTSNNGCLTRKTGDPGKDYPGDTVNASKWEKWGCDLTIENKFKSDLPLTLRCPTAEDGSMSVIIDSQQILEELQKELYDYYDCLAASKKDCDSKVPSEIKDINEIIDGFSGDANGDFKELENILNNFVPDPSGDADQAGLKDEIDKYKAYASFYKVGTHIDEDGDGCIDEDLLDGQDNDGDGLPNANARLASVDPDESLYYGVNAINNSMHGDNPYGYAGENLKYNKPMRLLSPVKIYNDPQYSTYTELRGDGDTVTVIGFTQEKYPDGSKYWTSRDMELKLKVAQDTVCSNLQYDLEYRKKNIGGCWPYYDECKFVKYSLRRELASPDEQKKRVHSSCKNYKATECPP